MTTAHLVLEAHVTMPVVDGRYGELTVTVRALADVKAVHLWVTIQRHDDGSPGFALLPGEEGYHLPELLAGQRETRQFAIRPLDPDVGRAYPGTAHATAPAGVAATARFEVFVEAHPAVYVALGVVEHLRRTAVGVYEAFKQTGREVHRDGTLARPRIAGTGQALSPGSFGWALGMVETGARYFRRNLSRRP